MLAPQMKIKKEAEELIKLGNEYYEEGIYQTAVYLYKQGLNLDQNRRATYVNRSAGNIILIEYTKGLKDAEKCIELD